MPLTYKEAQFVLTFTSGIAPEKYGTFESRLKQWKKMDMPEGVKVGKGQRAEYGAKQIFQLAIMLKLLRIGLTPERAIYTVERAWPTFKDSIVETVMCRANDADHLHYCFIGTDALHDLTIPGKEDMPVFVDLFTSDMIAIAYDVPDEDLTEGELSKLQYMQWVVKNRLATSICLEMDSLLIMIWAALAAMEKSGAIFHKEIFAWETDRRKRNRNPTPPDKKHFDALLEKGLGSMYDNIKYTNTVVMARQALRGDNYRENGDFGRSNNHDSNS